MRIPSSQREDRDKRGDICPAGARFYECGGRGYQGCCPVDACKTPGGCPRGLIQSNLLSIQGKQVTTVADVAPPVLVTLTSTAKNPSKTKPTGASSSRAVPPMTHSSPTTEAEGAWYSDKNAVPSSTVVSTSSSAVETLAINTSISAPETKSESAELSAAAKGGIIAAVAVVVFAIVSGYFMCGKQRRKLRSLDSISSTSRDGGKTVLEEDDGHPPVAANPFTPEDVVLPFGGRYEEPRTRLSQASDTGSSSRMMNHPVSPISRDSVVLQPPSAVIARTAAASPDLMSRMGTATPELQGPPQQAAIAELATPGLPRVVEIHSSRSGAQQYKPYRPNANSLYPIAETTPSYLTGTLSATEDERSRKKYVNSWSKWDPAT